MARLKSSADMVKAIEAAVRGSTRDQPTDEGHKVATPYADVWVSPDDWAEALQTRGAWHAAQRGARGDLGELLTILASKSTGRRR